jgi:hypothetical protein
MFSRPFMGIPVILYLHTTPSRARRLPRQLLPSRQFPDIPSRNECALTCSILLVGRWSRHAIPVRDTESRKPITSMPETSARYGMPSWSQ